MNISKNFKMMSVFSLAAAFATASHANNSVRPEFVTTDQPFVIFKAVKGGKYPFMFKCYPGMNQLDVIYFGTEKSSGVKFVKKERDLENLVTIRHSFNLADNKAVQLDKKFTGYRDSHLGTGLESLFKAIGWYPSAGYKGAPFVDEYKAGLPMKWALCNVEAFKSLKKYLLKSFTAANLVVPSVKPLLLLEFADTQEALDASDYEFLNKYYELLDPKDPIVKKFFYDANEALSDIANLIKDPIIIGAGLGETILNSIEGDKYLKGFDSEKIRNVVLGLILAKVAERAYFAVKGEVDPIVEAGMAKYGLSTKSLIKAALIGGGSVVGSYLAYRIIMDIMGSEEDYAGLDEAEAFQEVDETEEAEA